MLVDLIIIGVLLYLVSLIPMEPWVKHVIQVVAVVIVVFMLISWLGVVDTAHTRPFLGSRWR